MKFEQKIWIVCVAFLSLVGSAFIVSVADAAVCVSETQTVDAYQNIEGGGAFGKQAAVQFTIASQCDVGLISVEASAYDTPADNLQATIYSDSSDLPFAQLSATTTFSDPVAFSSHAVATTTHSYCLEAGTYQLVLSRSDESQTGNLYQWWFTTAGSPATVNSALSVFGWGSENVGSAMYYQIEDGGSACGGGGGGRSN